MTDFDEIRPYHDDELPIVYEELIADPAFRSIATTAFPQIPYDVLIRQMRACRTKLEFQKKFCYAILTGIESRTTQGVTLDRTAQADNTAAAYTYISNHRDIILDSGFLDIQLVNQGLDTVEIAIGDNLLIYPWIKKFVRINKSFIVQRDLPMRQMLESSQRLSAYMHYTIGRKQQSVWIAQREGRAKDSNDRTQDSLLKMFAMAGEGDVIDRLMQLHIVPLSISYEFDPCDFLKAAEFQLKRDNPDYKKSKSDDLLNMQTGLTGKKGHVHLQTAPCINEQLAQIDRSQPKHELYAEVAALIDRAIHAAYHIYPVNYIAYDLLSDTDTYTDRYTRQECHHFADYLYHQLARINLRDKDIHFLREKILQMYANPLVNHLNALHSNKS
ncbi:MAG: acyltransferase [Prevotellaceae bacterium]|jgi:hypothetical protein|nr:acyltransferase [Prevotellaceae bacterium]